MKKPQRPFAARISFEDRARLAIAEALDRRPEIELSWVSRNVLGRNHAYLFQYLFKKTPQTLNYGDAVKLSHFLHIDATVFLPTAAQPAALSEHLNPPSPNSSGYESDYIPIYGSLEQTPDAISISGNPIGNTPCHPSQKGMKDGFAFYAVGENMSPRYRPGELVYAVLNKPPVHGQDCVVEMQNGAAYLRQFDRRAGKDILCHQLSPAREWKRLAGDVKAIHAVVGRG